MYVTIICNNYCWKFFFELKMEKEKEKCDKV